MNVSELRIAKAVIERERENETAEVRILFGESVDATTRQFFFSFLSTESDEGNEGAFE